MIFFQIFTIAFISKNRIIPQTTFVPTFWPHTISELGGVKYDKGLFMELTSDALKIVLTDITFERLFFFMNRCNMSIHARFLRTGVVTDVAFEWFLSFMNTCKMWFHVTFCRTPVVANVTFEWLLSFASWFTFNVIFWKQLKSQISHLSGFFSTWTDATWVFKFLFWHLTGFFPLCTDATC